MQIRRAEAADEEALARIRRSAILVLAVPVMSWTGRKWRRERPSSIATIRAMTWVAVEGEADGRER